MWAIQGRWYIKGAIRLFGTLSTPPILFDIRGTDFFVLFEASDSTSAIPITLTNNTWYFIAITWDKTANSGNPVCYLSQIGGNFNEGVSVAIGNNEEGSKNTQISSGLDTNAWTHLCFTFNPLTDVVNTYVNGIFNATRSDRYIGYAAANAYVGTDPYDNTNREYSGGLDEIRIYNRTLGSNEVLRLYQIGRLDN